MKVTKTKTDREQSMIANEYVWDTVSDTEAHHFIEPVLKKWFKDKVGSKLLDLGCGNGVLTSKIADLGLVCTGTDYSESGILIAQNAFQNANFFQSTIELPLHENHRAKYDIVIAVEVIEHLFLPRQLFDRAKEALNDDGTFILTTPYHGYWKNLALALVNKYDYHWHPLRDYGHIKFFSNTTLCKLFEEQGFIIEEVKKVGRIPIFARSIMIKGKLKN